MDENDGALGRLSDAHRLDFKVSELAAWAYRVARLQNLHEDAQRFRTDAVDFSHIYFRGSAHEPRAAWQARCDRWISTALDSYDEHPSRHFRKMAWVYWILKHARFPGAPRPTQAEVLAFEDRVATHHREWKSVGIVRPRGASA